MLQNQRSFQRIRCGVARRMCGLVLLAEINPKLFSNRPETCTMHRSAAIYENGNYAFALFLPNTIRATIQSQQKQSSFFFSMGIFCWMHVISHTHIQTVAMAKDCLNEKSTRPGGHHNTHFRESTHILELPAEQFTASATKPKRRACQSFLNNVHKYGPY